MQPLQKSPDQAGQQDQISISEPKGHGAHIPTLDGIRACAFLLVFFAHAGLDKVWSTSGAFGVTIFFFLSGYLITSLLRLDAERTKTISLGKVYLHRSFRILPPMYITLAIGYVLGVVGVLHERGNTLGLISAIAYFYNYADLLSHHAKLPNGMGALGH
jgi:peptidoglycan/LPS O-acetylase OafA/YrhL